MGQIKEMYWNITIWNYNIHNSSAIMAITMLVGRWFLEMVVTTSNILSAFYIIHLLTWKLREISVIKAMHFQILAMEE